MHPRHYALGAATAAALALAATSAEAVVTFDSDAEFINSRFGGATEFAVVQGQSGRNSGSNAQSAEAQIAVPAFGGNVNSTKFNGFWQDGAVDFTVDYDSSTLTFSADRKGSQLFELSEDVTFTDANSIFIRAAAGGNSSTSLTNLAFDSSGLPDVFASGASSEQYIGFSYGNLADTWSLTGTATLTGIDSNARPSFQVKLNEAVVPLPAAAWLMISGLAGVGYTAYRRKASATA